MNINMTVRCAGTPLGHDRKRTLTVQRRTRRPTVCSFLSLPVLLLGISCFNDLIKDGITWHSKAPVSLGNYGRLSGAYPKLDDSHPNPTQAQ